jgi:hypothetical protein
MVRNEDDRAAKVRRRFSSSDTICASTVASSAVVGSSASRQVGLDRERHRDHHALPHSARSWCGYESIRSGAVRNADGRKRCDRAAPRLVARHSGMAAAKHVPQMRADREQRVERRHWILEDHRNPRAAIGVHRRLPQRDQVHAVEQDLALEPRHVGGQEAQQARGEARLAGTRLADDSQDATLADVEVDAAQDVGGAARGERLQLQLADGDERARRFNRRTHPSMLLPDPRIDRVAQRLAEQREAECRNG